MSLHLGRLFSGVGRIVKKVAPIAAVVAAGIAAPYLAPIVGAAVSKFGGSAGGDGIGALLGGLFHHDDTQAATAPILEAGGFGEGIAVSGINLLRGIAQSRGYGTEADALLGAAIGGPPLPLDLGGDEDQVDEYDDQEYMDEEEG